MKIGFVFDDTLDSTDGVQQCILALGAQFTKKGHEVHYLVGQSKRSDISHVHSLSRNIKVGFNKNTLSTPLPASKRKIRSLLVRESFDVLHVQMPYSPFMAGRVLGQAGRMRLPVVGTFHILPASRFEAFSIKLLGKILTRSKVNIAKIMAVSAPAKVCAESTFTMPAKVVPNPVDIHTYKPNKLKEITADVIHILFVGRLVARKGCHELLQSLVWLNERGHLGNVRVSICGDGVQRTLLEQYVKFHKLHSVVTFYGRVSEQDKINRLQSADIAVFPSTGGESFGIVLIEAMAAGAPVVLAGDNPGYRSVMNDNEQQLVEPHNTAVFAAQMLHFIQNPKARAHAQKWQQKHVLQFDISQVSSKVMSVYEEAIAKVKKD